MSYLRSGAQFSDDRLYRFKLWRCWDEGLPSLGWILLNPSTADAAEDDPTIRRCVGFARRWGFGGVVVANLFGWRATAPAELATPKDPVGRALPGVAYSPWEMLWTCSTVVAGWGAAAESPFVSKRVMQVACSDPARRQLFCLGRTKGGHPRHPLYVRGDAELCRWVPPLRHNG